MNNQGKKIPADQFNNLGTQSEAERRLKTKQNIKPANQGKER